LTSNNSISNDGEPILKSKDGNVWSADAEYICELCGCLVKGNYLHTHYGFSHRQYCTYEEYFEGFIKIDVKPQTQHLDEIYGTCEDCGQVLTREAYELHNADHSITRSR